MLRQKCSGQSALFPLSGNKLQTPLGIFQPLTTAGCRAFLLSTILRLVVPVWRGVGSGKYAAHGNDLRAGTRYTLSVLCNRLPATHDTLRGRLLPSPSHTSNNFFLFSGAHFKPHRAAPRKHQSIMSAVRRGGVSGDMRQCRACQSQLTLLIMASVVSPVVFGIYSTILLLPGLSCAPYS